MKNKFTFLVVGVVAVFVAGFILFKNDKSCDASSATCSVAGSQTAKSESKLDVITRELKDGAILVDVREAEEFAAGHAEGSINFSLTKIQAGGFPTDNKNTKIYVYCRSGKRAATAQGLLKTAGYNNTTSLGGLTDWQQMGGTVVKQVE